MQTIASTVESSGTRRQLTANLDLGRYRYCDLGKSQVQMTGQRMEGTGSRRTQEASDVIFGGRGAKWVVLRDSSILSRVAIMDCHFSLIFHYTSSY